MSFWNANFIPPSLAPPHPKHPFSGFGSNRRISLNAYPLQIVDRDVP
jgi:hypothetical protein